MRKVRLIADTSLELLARRLRVLGYDVETTKAKLELLFETARGHGRTVLTPSARHPKRFADVPALVVPNDDPERAVRQVMAWGTPDDEPFSRCSCCNVSLEMGPVSEARGQVPDAIVSSGQNFRRCPRCHRWYWHGSHVDRLRDWLGRASGRPIAPPHDDRDRAGG